MANNPNNADIRVIIGAKKTKTYSTIKNDLECVINKLNGIKKKPEVELALNKANTQKNLQTDLNNIIKNLKFDKIKIDVGLNNKSSKNPSKSVPYDDFSPTVSSKSMTQATAVLTKAKEQNINLLTAEDVATKKFINSSKEYIQTLKQEVAVRKQKAELQKLDDKEQQQKNKYDEKIKSFDSNGTASKTVEYYRKLSESFSGSDYDISRKFQELQKVYTEIQNMKLISSDSDDEVFKQQMSEKIQQYEKLEKAIKDVVTVNNKMNNFDVKSNKNMANMQGLLNSIQKYRQQNDRLNNKSNLKSDFDDLELQAKNFISNGNFGKNEFEALTAEFNKGKNAVREFGMEGQTWTTRLQNQFQKLATYFSAAVIMLGAWRQIKNIIQDVISLDKAITDLQIATGMTRNETKELLNTYSQLGKELGATTLQIAQAADDWLRTGKSIEVTNKLIKDSAMLSKLGKIDTSEATKALSTMQKSYELLDKDMTSIVDKFTAVDAVSATTAGGIAKSFQETAVSARLLGIDIDRMTGYIARVSEVSGAGDEEVGNFFKTFLARMSNIKEGRLISEDTGEDLSTVETVLKNMGIYLRDNNGQFRNFQNVLDETAVKWNEFERLGDTVGQAKIASALGLTRQAEKVKILFEGYSQALQYAEVAANSAGTALKKYENSYLNSVLASQERFTAQFDELSNTVLNSDLIKGTYDTGTGLLGFFTLIAKFLNDNIIGNLIRDITLATVSIIGFKAALNGLKAVGEAQWFKKIFDISSISALSSHFSILSVNCMTLTGKLKYLTGVWLSTPFGQAIAIIAGIYALIKVTDLLTTSTEEYAETLSKVKSEAEEAEGKLETIKQKLEENVRVLQELKALDDPTFTNQQDIKNLEIENQLLQTQLELQKNIAKEKNIEKHNAFQDNYDSYMNGDNNPSNGEFDRYIPNSTKLPEDFQAYEDNKTEINRLSDEIANAIDNNDKKLQAKLEKQKTNLENKNAEIYASLSDSMESFQTMSSGINYGEDEETDKILDKFQDFYERFNNLNKTQAEKAKAEQEKAVEVFKNILVPKELTTESTNARKQLNTELESLKASIGDVTKEIKIQIKEASDEWNKLTNGNVDYNKRPVISAKEMQKYYPDFDGDYATTYTTGYDFFKDNIEIPITMTPILDNGKICTTEELDKYFDKIVKDAKSSIDILNADKPENGGLGLVVHIATSKEEMENVEDSLNEWKDKHLDAWEQLQIQQSQPPKLITSKELLSDTTSDGYKQLVEIANEYKITLTDLIPILEEYGIVQKDALDPSNIYASSDIPSVLKGIIDKTKELSSAYKEQTDNGKISASTLQSLMVSNENWTELVTIENGVVKLNTEAVIENAKSHINAEIEKLEASKKACQERIAAYGREIETLNRLSQAGIISSIIAKQNLSNLRASLNDEKESIENLDTTIEYLKSISINNPFDAMSSSIEKFSEKAKKAQSAINSLVTMTVNMLKQKANSRKDDLNEELEALKKNYDFEKDELNDLLDSYKKIIDMRKKALNDDKDNNDYQKELDKKNNEIAKIENQISEITNDDSADGIKRKLELEELLADKKEELSDFQTDKAHDKAIGALDDEYKRFEELQKSKLDKLEEQYNYDKEIQDRKLKDVEEYLNNTVKLNNEAYDLIQGKTTKYYDDLMSWNLKYGDGLKSTVIVAWDNAYKSLDTFGLGEKTVLDILNELVLATDNFKLGMEGAATSIQNASKAAGDLKDNLAEVNKEKGKINDADDKGYYPRGWGSKLSNSSNTKIEIDLSKFKKYSSGGLNTTTGLAMLHGTSSKPETVINSSDSSKLWNFIKTLPLPTSRVDSYDLPLKNLQDVSKSMSPVFNMGNIIIQGNADKKAVNEIENRIKQSFKEFSDQLSNSNKNKGSLAGY